MDLTTVPAPEDIKRLIDMLERRGFGDDPNNHFDKDRAWYDRQARDDFESELLSDRPDR